MNDAEPTSETQIIIRVSTLTGNTHVREVTMTTDQYIAWVLGTPAEAITPSLSAEDLDYLSHGITPEERARLG